MEQVTTYYSLFFCMLLGTTGNLLIPIASDQKQALATFAGGCFWCMEPPFEKLEGITDVRAGYMGGTAPNPTYTNYATQGHTEVVQITYDSTQISYKQLLDTFWRQIDPTDAGGQFVDRGPQYRSIIFYHTEEQKQEAETSKRELAASDRFSKPIVTEILPASTFYSAEEYHQDYAKAHPWKYQFYRLRSGRDQFLQSIWGQKELADQELRKKLTPLQYQVTQQNKTEPPFSNEYWDTTQPGIYVDIVSGEPLFSSLDKFTSGTGWPSFTRPLEPNNMVLKEDRGWFTTRTEVRSKQADSHLGHVFKDGPLPTGLRYCINSAALRFIPVEELQDDARYKQYALLFDNNT